MTTKRIKLKDTTILNNINKDASVDVELMRSTKLLPFGDVAETISQQEVFEQERNNTTKYRLIVTITPYCSNVLFNVLTEVVKNEGGSNVHAIVDTSTVGSAKIKASPDSMPIACVASLNKQPSRIEMIQNTEYSKTDLGYVYLPGYDIFNNHILRNTTFKIVNKASSPTAEFNTIKDYMRNFSGSQVMFAKRMENASATMEKKHLYDVSDILSISDSINANLIEENGWFGFINSSTIGAMGITNAEWNKNANISRVLNNRNGCDFIDMYPDRTLYSFVPKYNSFRHRPEYNWHLCLTYPSDKMTNHPLVKNIADGGDLTMGLAILYGSFIETYTAKQVMYFRTYIKHGLSAGDYVYVYYSNDYGKNYIRTNMMYKVDGVGDIKKNNEDFYFYISDLKLVEEFMESVGKSDIDAGDTNQTTAITNVVNNMKFRFTHCVNGIESEYYFRKFTKLPNFRFKHGDIGDCSDINTYINDNAKNTSALLGDTRYGNLSTDIRNWGGGALSSEHIKTQTKSDKIIEFDTELYKLSFANTTYGDEVAQCTFTDSIDIDGLVDHCGRPLTEIYLTIIKNNSGHWSWYEDSAQLYSPGDATVEYSHCFGRVTSGLNIHGEDGDNDEIRELRAQMSDIRLINNLNVYHSKSLGEELGVNIISSDENGLTDYKGKEDITRFCDNFIGDVVEFIPSDFKEVTLSPVLHRFNTAQREQFASPMYNTFSYDEIITDDYDLDGFNVQNKTVDGGITVGDVTLKVYDRPEGYYYQSYYHIPVREFGQVVQGSHNTLKITAVKPIQRGGIFIEVTCGMVPNVSIGDMILICDDNTGVEYKSNVVSVVNNHTFIMSPIEGLGWIKFCDIMNSEKATKRFVLRRVNPEIPSYAYKVSSNRYLWRNVRSNADSDNNAVADYAFTNGHLYINKNIDFFLKRQDPHGENGLYAMDVFPNDIFGSVKKEKNSEYKDETETSKC